MLQYIREYGEYVEITGYRGIAFELAEAFLKTNRKQNEQNVNIQFFDADLIATQEHLYFATLNALQAFKNNTNHSKSPAMETLLYASAQRQIKKAIECCGIKPKTKNLAIAIIGDDPDRIRNAVKAMTECFGSKPDETVLSLTKPKETKIRKAFNINKEELETQKNETEEEAIANLVIERVALLSTLF